MSFGFACLVALHALLFQGSHPRLGEAMPIFELVESVPVETKLDDPEIRDTPEVWREMIAGADSLLEIETFYVTADSSGHAFSAVLSELERAQARGVRIRLLVDAGFSRTYPEMLDSIHSWPCAEVRVLDAKALWGGVLHAKCLVVDRDDLFMGSQNWDWRALAHIRELGIRIRHQGAVRAFRAIVTADWALGKPWPNGGGTGEETTHGHPGGARQDTVFSGPFRVETASGETATVRCAASPPRGLVPGIPWDEPLLLAMIDSASRTVCAQVLTFCPVGGRAYHDALECALKRAAAKGVEVRLLVSNWSTRPGMLPYVRSLAHTPGIEVRFSTIPQWSGGFIPYARVEHPKYAVVDDEHCWIGTSNWTRGGFHESRNLSLFIEGGRLPAMVRRYFDRGWTGQGAERVDGCTDYHPPRIGD